ncbi:hypothetical protein [Halopseudomonas maritima]|uniref:hypothetical protein n=1 Tax=Halopseudomonas maritima TaxID=2918528 RepID=UPI001EEA8C67|nr:hypothetical protein [Halopseudomonas maritima]UJJ32585.1 hypothetical protein HV822_05335 [Halopseudomonas maritima]
MSIKTISIAASLLISAHAAAMSGSVPLADVDQVLTEGDVQLETPFFSLQQEDVEEAQEVAWSKCANYFPSPMCN